MGNPIGRPPKKPPNKTLGRPKGERAIMEEYKMRLLNSPKSRKVFDAIFEAALDNEHKNQSAAWKIITDRLIPVGLFEKAVGGAQRSAIQINITGIGSPSVVTQGTTEEEAEDAEWSEEPSPDPLGHLLGGT